jgi:spore coat protein U-like protein
MATSAFAAGPVIDESVDFTGQRAVECSIANFQDTVLFGALGRRGQAAQQSDTGIDVFCNQPSTVSFESENGYLALQTVNNANDSISESDFTSAANPGFSAGLDYTASIPAFGISGDTSDLDAGVAVTYSPVPALNLNNIRINYDTIAENQPLLGGLYEDTLSITLTPNGV